MKRKLIGLLCVCMLLSGCGIGSSKPLQTESPPTESLQAHLPLLEQGIALDECSNLRYIPNAALLACMVLIKKDREIVYRKMDKISIVLNFLIALVAFPFIFMVSVLSEIVSDTSVWQQLLYVTPALTVLGIAASVAVCRCGYGKCSLFVRFTGPLLFAFELSVVSQ